MRFRLKIRKSYHNTLRIVETMDNFLLSQIDGFAIQVKMLGDIIYGWGYDCRKRALNRSDHISTAC
jgi:hypothetical protein